jgi:hypothetical protein
VADEARGLAIVGFGRGNVPPAITPALGDAVRRRHRHDLVAIARGPREPALRHDAAARSSPGSARSSPAIFPAPSAAAADGGAGYEADVTRAVSSRHQV